MPLAFIYHEDYLKHKTGFMHPESEQRLVAMLEHLQTIDLWNAMEHITPEPSQLRWIAKVHSIRYIEFVSEMCRIGETVLDSGDTHVSRDSYAAALLAAGGVLAGVDFAMRGDNHRAFCAVRPPGHHAEHDHAMGFCLFNNIAIGARYAQEHHGLTRVAIVDWDVHHGNGTQAAFYDDPSVLYVSIHQYPYYPGTGGKNERGAGNGTGTTLNIPLNAGSGDEVYLDAMREIIVPALVDFSPELIMISAGFDAHRDDPLAGMNVTEKGFGEMTRLILEASESARGRIVSVLEGGYDLKALGRSVESHLRELMKISF